MLSIEPLLASVEPRNRRLKHGEISLRPLCARIGFALG